VTKQTELSRDARARRPRTSRIVDQAFSAFEKSAEDGVREVTNQTIENRHVSGKLGLRGKVVTNRVRKDAGDIATSKWR
jgi:hypothetical protein